MLAHWRAILGVILVFVFGCVAGAFTASIHYHHRLIRILQHPGAAVAAEMEKRLTGNIGLDANQKQEVHAIFLENAQHRKEVQKQVQPQIQALNQRLLSQIAAILRPDQAALYQKNLTRLHKRLLVAVPDQTAPLPGSSPTPVGAGVTNTDSGSHP
jgi:hypothetical protein